MKLADEGALGPEEEEEVEEEIEGGVGRQMSSVEGMTINRLQRVGLATAGTVLSTVNIRPVALFFTTTSLTDSVIIPD